MDRRWDPFTALATIDRQFDELVRRAWSPPAAGNPGRAVTRRTAGFVPAVEMRTVGSDVVIRLELPGVDVNRDVSIEVDRGRLIITGERHDTTGDESGGVLVRELRYGSFRREFALPDGIEASQVEASYDAGTLPALIHNVVPPETEPQRVPLQASTATGAKVVEGSAHQVEPGESAS